MENKFLQKDKILHISACIIIVVVFGTMFNLVTGVIAAVIASLAKEALDEYNYGGWDNEDLLADGVGIIIGILFGMLL